MHFNAYKEMKMKKLLMCMIISSICILQAGCGKTVDASQPTETAAQVEDTNTPEASILEEKSAVSKDEVLPIGTVVKLEGDNQKYMIISHNYVMEETQNMVWPYAACIYPGGNMNAKAAIVFKNEDIDQVLFKGLEDLEEDKVVSEKPETYLPLGTVIKVQGLETPIMIFGRSQQQEGNDKIYDYAACDYPAGSVNPEDTYLFDNEIIEKIYYVGYIDEDETKFQQYLIQNLGEQ